MRSKLSPVHEVAFALDTVQGNCHLNDLSWSKADIILTADADMWPIKLTLSRSPLSLFLSKKFRNVYQPQCLPVSISYIQSDGNMKRDFMSGEFV